jgi:hypothetical protein
VDVDFFNSFVEKICDVKEFFISKITYLSNILFEDAAHCESLRSAEICRTLKNTVSCESLENAKNYNTLKNTVNRKSLKGVHTRTEANNTESRIMFDKSVVKYNMISDNVNNAGYVKANVTDENVNIEKDEDIKAMKNIVKFENNLFLIKNFVRVNICEKTFNSRMNNDATNFAMVTDATETNKSKREVKTMRKMNSKVKNLSENCVDFIMNSFYFVTEIFRTFVKNFSNFCENYVINVEERFTSLFVNVFETFEDSENFRSVNNSNDFRNVICSKNFKNVIFDLLNDLMIFVSNIIERLSVKKEINSVLITKTVYLDM